MYMTTRSATSHTQIVDNVQKMYNKKNKNLFVVDVV